MQTGKSKRRREYKARAGHAKLFDGLQTNRNDRKREKQPIQLVEGTEQGKIWLLEGGQIFVESQGLQFRVVR